PRGRGGSREGGRPGARAESPLSGVRGGARRRLPSRQRAPPAQSPGNAGNGGSMKTLLDMLRRFPVFQPRDTFGSPNRAPVEILARASLAVPPMSEGVARRLAAWLGSVVEALAALDGTLSRLRDDVRDLKPAVAQARSVEALRPLVD